MTLSNQATAFVAAVCCLFSAASLCPADGSGFENVCSWEAYDPGDNGLGNHPDGYHGAIFDGRYIYFVPYRDVSENFHGEVLRYDTLGDYSDISSWATFDPGANGVGTQPVGYASGVFDGRYVYFVPWANNFSYHGEVLRYDTTGPFSDVASWAAFDPGRNGVGNDPDGYRGGVFDGRYVYFAPTYNGSHFHAEVLRFDTLGDFSDASSWNAFDPGDHGVGFDPDGYSYAAFDGRYVYFGPYHNGTAYHGEVLRLDTTGQFDDPGAWATFDPGRNGVGNDPDGYAGVIFDGRFVYFVPFNNGTTYHSEVLRYDTLAAFDQTASWMTFDAAANGLGDNPTGYCGAVYDSRYIYFVPFYNDTTNHDEALRYDTIGDFSDPAAWCAFNPAAHGVGAENHGYREGTFDGRYVYFAAGGWQPAHGEILRYDTTAPAGDLDCDGCVNQADLGILLADWGCTTDCIADLDHDGDTDQADLGLLLAHWGEGCP